MTSSLGSDGHDAGTGSCGSKASRRVARLADACRGYDGLDPGSSHLTSWWGASPFHPSPVNDQARIRTGLSWAATIDFVKVSLVTTVKDARPHISQFFDSVRAQSIAPDEVVVVDGGSTDGTLEWLHGATGILVLSAPG